MQNTIVNKKTNETITFLEQSEQTRGQYLLLQCSLPANKTSLPMLTHDYFEKEIQMIEGEIVVQLKNDEPFVIYSGDRIGIAKKCPHVYKNESNKRAIFYLRVAPAKKFEQWLTYYFHLINEDLIDDKGRPKNKVHEAYLHMFQQTWHTKSPIWLQRITYSRIVSSYKRKTGSNELPYELIAKKSYVKNQK